MDAEGFVVGVKLEECNFICSICMHIADCAMSVCHMLIICQNSLTPVLLFANPVIIVSSQDM